MRPVRHHGRSSVLSIGEVLLERHKITGEQLSAALAARKHKHDRIERILIDMGHVKEIDVLEIIGEQLSMPVVDLATIEIDEALLKEIPSKVVHKCRLVPIDRRNGTIRVATASPYDVYAIDELAMLTGCKIESVLALEGDIQRIIKQHYGVGGKTVEEMISASDVEVVSDFEESEQDLIEEAQEATVVKLVNEILVEAIRDRASDVHIEPFEHELRIRYRVDGVLQPTSIPPQIRRFQNAIISRIKILSNLNIAEKRLPQDGGFKIRAHGREIDLRVSIIPTAFGEAVVMRILDKQSVSLSLPALGMKDETYERFQKLITIPHGIILVTGPTGSGKTTTLYAALNSIRSDAIKVLTVEDPIEYYLDGINQVQIKPRIGLTFASALRSFLRHDPDVILVGEIRDFDTAEVAINAALTGHLVFSTLHTNDAASATTRLLDMGVEPFLVSSAIEGILAQRLVRKICPDCQEEYTPEPDKLPPDFPIEGVTTLLRGTGCRDCRQTGYRGRVGIFELIVLDDELRQMILKRSSATELCNAARTHGLTLLRDDGWANVKAGLTTVEEIMRVSKVAAVGG